LKNSSAIFQAGDARRRVKHAVIDDEIRIMAANRGLSQRLCAVILEKWQNHFSSYLIIAGTVEKELVLLFNCDDYNGEDTGSGSGSCLSAVRL